MMIIRWYGVMYVVAFWLAWALVPYLGKKRNVDLSRDQWTLIIACGAAGVLIGGRLGYALFYDPTYFISYPIELFKIWHGGMSSHGGFIGAALGVWIGARRTPVQLFAVADILAVPAAFGLAFGRIGNITNNEFGMYPYYEAVGDVLIAVVCFVLIYTPHPRPLPERERGTIFSIFLILYSIIRFVLEYVRPQDWPLTFGFSRGQILTVPLLAVGVLLFFHVNKRRISA